MSHEPECLVPDFKAGVWVCICRQLRAAYRRGFNDHARSRAYGEAVYGPYGGSGGAATGVGEGFQVNQHGKGTNP